MCVKSQVLNDLKYHTVFIGRNDEYTGTVDLVATGFLIEIQGVPYLVTAKHIIVKKDNNGELTNLISDDHLRIVYRNRSNEIKIRKISDLKKTKKIDWIFHDSIYVDYAIIPFLLETDTINALPLSSTIQTGELYELIELYFPSFLPNQTVNEDLSPIYRRGHISRINEDKTMYIEAYAYPGNSGSPIFMATSLRAINGRVVNSPGLSKLVGVIGEYETYIETAVSPQTGRTRITFEENAGMILVWTVDYLNDIIKSESLKKQLENISK